MLGASTSSVTRQPVVFARIGQVKLNWASAYEVDKALRGTVMGTDIN